MLISVTVGLLLALVWIDFTGRSTLSAIKTRDLRVKELRGDIARLDEVLTMSALMYAVAGDVRWEHRYREFEPQLASAIDQALLAAPSENVHAAAAETAQANERLLTLEHNAFARVQAGQLDEAQAILSSREYKNSKDRYAQGSKALDHALQDFIASSDAALVREGWTHAVLDLSVVVFVALGWFIYFRKMFRSESALVDSHGKLQTLAAELACANQSLEQHAEKLAHTNADLAESNLHLSTEIQTRIQAEAAQKELHHRLLDATRQAGMAEIATGVLHNVGNALNSVNVAATLSMDLALHSRVRDFPRAIQLMMENAGDLAGFFTANPRGQLMLPYLSELSVALRTEHSQLLENLEDLCNKVDHTKQIVKSQQSYAKVTDLDTEFDPLEVVEDMLKTLCASFEEKHIELVKEWHDVPLLFGDKHKVMQVLANLVTNAIHALLSAIHSDKRLTVRLYCCDDDTVAIDVEDNGIGIDGAHLTKIFQYGFTTKQSGHGFGLHHSALVARELGGELRVYSEGLGRGARFTLEMPIARQTIANCDRELVAV